MNLGVCLKAFYTRQTKTMNQFDKTVLSKFSSKQIFRLRCVVLINGGFFPTNKKMLLLELTGILFFPAKFSTFLLNTRILKLNRTKVQVND